MPHKGKKAEFFSITRDAGEPVLTQEQKNFVYRYYPEYAFPEDMVNILEWLGDVAYDEDPEDEANKAYAKRKEQQLALQNTALDARLEDLMAQQL
jgi:hypothetical protein